MSLKFSLSRMMLFVFIVAFGLAAAIASLYKFVVIAFCTATAIAMFSRGPARAFCLGFALTGWIFMTFLLGAGMSHKYAWPTMHPIDRFYRSIYPYPVTSRNYDQQSIRQLRVWIDRRKEAITNVHSLIALNLGFIGGAITWFASTRRAERNNHATSTLIPYQRSRSCQTTTGNSHPITMINRPVVPSATKGPTPSAS